jgi:hypothetical protein
LEAWDPLQDFVLQVGTGKTQVNALEENAKKGEYARYRDSRQVLKSLSAGGRRAGWLGPLGWPSRRFYRFPDDTIEKE